MSKNAFIFSVITTLLVAILYHSFIVPTRQNKSVTVDHYNISGKEETKNKPLTLPQAVQRGKGFYSANVFSNMFFSHHDADREPDIKNETDQTFMDEQQKLELFVQNAAIQNIPLDMVTLGRLKEYYINTNNLVGYQQFIDSLPDAYEMKSELLSDLAFSYQEHGHLNASLNLIQSLSYADTSNVRLKYYKSDIYLWAGYQDVAINTLLEASQLNEEPYQYLRIAEILEDAGDDVAADYYFEKADALEAIMHHTE
jgi:hypothetical protein